MTDFSQRVKRFLNRDPGNKKKLAQEFGVSHPTVQRWADDRNAPHPVLQPKVLELIDTQEEVARKEFSLLCQVFLKVKGGNLVQAADALFVSQPTFKRWIEGRNHPHPATRAALMKGMQAVIASKKTE